MGMWTLLPCKRRDRRSEELSEGKFSINEEGARHKKDEDIPEEGMRGVGGEDFTLKEVLKKVHNIESTKDKMLEADPNLERGITIYYDIVNMLTLYHK